MCVIYYVIICIEKRKLVNNMKEYTIKVYNVNTLETVDTFVAEFENVTELCDFMDTELHNYNEKYTNLDYKVKG